MTLKYMQGFETVRDDSDLRTQGWAPTPATPTRKTTVAIPSVTGVNGFSLRPLGAFQTLAYGTAAWGSSADQTFGTLNTGITLHQAWTAGGITLGYGARFNSTLPVSFASNFVGGGNSAGLQMCFDGSLYWAIRVGSGINVCYSSDLTTWTVAPSQPPNVTAGASLQFVAGNVVMVTGYVQSFVAHVDYSWSNNQGVSWSTGSTISQTNAGGGAGVAFATGNSTYPLGIAAFVTGIGSQGAIYIGNFGSLTSTLSLGSNGSNATASGATRTIGGNIFQLTVNVTANRLSMAPANSSTLNTSAAWTLAALTAPCVDVVYSATSNLYVFAASSGIYTTPNLGTAGNPIILGTSPTLTNRYSTAAIANLFNVGTAIIGVGTQGHIIKSTDGGVTWSEIGPHLISGSVSGLDWRGALYDGSRYVLWSDGTNGVIATTPDLETNYQATFAMENAEVAVSLGTSLAGAGLMLGTAPSASTGQWTPVTTANGFPYLVVTSISAGIRQYAFYNSSNTTTALVFGTFPYTTGYHYYEFKYTAVAGTTNMFNFAFYVDGVQITTLSNYQMSTTADTTSLFLVTFQRNGTFTAFDDIYVTLDDGINTVGPLGQVNIFARRPTTDVQAQWTKVGAAASNALSVNQAALSSQSTNAVTSNTPGDKDIYSSSDAIPSGYSVKAVQVEGYFTKTSTSAPSVSVGLISGSSESDGPTLTVGGTGPTYTSQIVEKDPNGNVAWTTAAVTASKPAINHIS